MYTLVVTGC